MPEIVRNVVKFTKIFEKYVTKNLSQNGSRFATPEVVLKKPAKLLLPVRQPSHRRAFSDSDHAECRGVYGLRLRSSVFARRTCVYSKIFCDIPLVGLTRYRKTRITSSFQVLGNSYFHGF